MISLSRTIEHSEYKSIVDLMEDAILRSKEQIFCFSKPNSQMKPAFPVRLTNPISRFDEVPSLQHICRYVIRNQNATITSINCLPAKLQDYVNKDIPLGKVGYFEDY